MKIKTDPLELKFPPQRAETLGRFGFFMADAFRTASLVFPETTGSSIPRIFERPLSASASVRSGSKACIASSLSLVEPIQTLDDVARIGLNRARRLSSSFEPNTSRQHAHQRMAD